MGYYPFGMGMPGRHYSSGNYYRYGFGGQEKSDEIKGASKSYTAEYWEYDPRIGRRWNRDPVINVSQSPYVAFDNSPILISDPSGANPGEEKPTGKGDNEIVAAYEIVKKRFDPQKNNVDISEQLKADALAWFTKTYDPKKNPQYAKMPMSVYQTFENVVMDMWYRAFATDQYHRYESNDKIIQAMSTTSGKALAIVALSEKDKKGAQFFFNVLLPSFSEIITGMAFTVGTLNTSTFTQTSGGRSFSLLKSTTLFSDIPEGAGKLLGQRGEDLTELMLRRSYPNAVIGKQVYYYFSKNSKTVVDFVVVQEGKILAIWEGKVNSAIMSDLQKALFIDGKAGTFGGKAAGQYGLSGKTVGDALRMEIRYNSKTGSSTIISH